MERPVARTRARVALAASLALLASLAAATQTGCKPTPEQIERWKGTQKGPDKLRDATTNKGLDPELRAQALVALAELAMLGEVEKDLSAEESDTRRPVVHLAVPRLQALALSATPGASADRKRIQAKDALFTVREWASKEDRELIDTTLVDWLCADLGTRITAGGHGGDKIFDAVGAGAASRLATLVGDPSASEASLMEAAKALGRIGDAASRERAGAALVERARKQKTPEDPTLQQIGLVGGDHAVAYLTALAEDTHESAAVRSKALLSLAQRGDAAGLPAALRLAGDKRAPGRVRDAAFQLAEKIGQVAVSGLLKLMDDPDERVRWEAVEAALGAGKEKAVIPVLERLSPTRSYDPETVRAYVVHDLALIGPPALEPLREALRSRSWIARVVAARAIGEIGKAADADAVAALATDAAPLRGWPAGATVGSEARAVAEALRARH